MMYGALNTVTTADVEHAREAISDVSNVKNVLVIFAIVCYTFSISFHPRVEDSSIPILIIL